MGAGAWVWVVGSVGVGVLAARSRAGPVEDEISYGDLGCVGGETLTGGLVEETDDASSGPVSTLLSHVRSMYASSYSRGWGIWV